MTPRKTKPKTCGNAGCGIRIICARFVTENWDLILEPFETEVGTRCNHIIRK